MRPTSILHINSYFLTSCLHHSLVEKLSELEMVRQEVYCPINVEDPEADVRFNSKTIYLSIRRCFSVFHRKIWPLKMGMIWWDFWKWQKGREFDVVHAHTLVVNGIIAYLNYHKTGTPYIVTVRNTDANRFLLRNPFIKWLIRPVLINAKGIVFLGPAYWLHNFPKAFSPSFLEKIKGKVEFIPNGIDDFWHLNLVTQKKQLSDTFRILFIGKLNSNKNANMLIDACKRLKDKGYDIILDIVGHGPKEKELRQSAGTLNVMFHGQVKDKNQLALLYRTADVLAVISKTESFGLVYAEALSQGTPILYTKRQGFDGIFPEGEVGYSVESSNLDDVVDKLMLIWKERDRLFERVLLVRDEFSWKRSVEKILKLYGC